MDATLSQDISLPMHVLIVCSSVCHCKREFAIYKTNLHFVERISVSFTGLDGVNVLSHPADIIFLDK